MKLLLWLMLLVPAGLWAQNQNLGNVTVNNIQVNGKCTGNCAGNAEINVKAPPFSAVGDGTADDTAAIAAAMAACAPNQTIFFPQGTYKTTSTITLRTGCSLKGSGMYTSIIEPLTAGQTVFTFTGVDNSETSQSNIEIFELQIQAHPSLTAGNTSQIGISCTFCHTMRIHDVVFSGLQNNVYFDRGTNVSITNVISVGQGNPYLRKAGNLLFTSTDNADHIFNTTVDNYHCINEGPGTIGPLVFIRAGIATNISNMTNNDANIGGAVNGIVIEGDSQGVKISHVTIAAPAVGLLIQQGSGSIWPTFTDIDSLDIDQAHTNAVHITAGQWINIRGSMLTASAVNVSGSALVIEQTSTTSFITIIANNIVGYTSGSGVSIAPGLSHIIIAYNSFQLDAVGVGLQAGSSDYINISNNNMANASNSVVLGMPNTGTHNVIAFNAVPDADTGNPITPFVTSLTYSAATLPIYACNTGKTHAMACVSDSTACTNGTTYASGGATACRLYCNGTNWKQTGSGC